MKRKINQLCLFMLLGAALFSTASCSERVDAGSEGILVNLYGSDKGVDDVSLVYRSCVVQSFHRGGVRVPYLCADY